MNDKNKKLYRSRSNRMIAGVCGGLAEYFNIDPVIVRIIFVLLVLGNGAGVLIYIVLALVMPQEPVDKSQKNSKVDKDEIKKNAQVFAQDIKTKAQSIKDEFSEGQNWLAAPNIIALVLIIVGLAFLLQNFLPFHFLSWNYIWPLIIILVGLIMIISINKGKK